MIRTDHLLADDYEGSNPRLEERGPQFRVVMRGKGAQDFRQGGSADLDQDNESHDDPNDPDVTDQSRESPTKCHLDQFYDWTVLFFNCLNLSDPGQSLELRSQIGRRPEVLGGVLVGIDWENEKLLLTNTCANGGHRSGANAKK